MPELPEVETIVRDLRQDLVGKRIKGVHFLRRSVWRRKAPGPGLFLDTEITRLDRKGKNIMISLSNEKVLIIHLKMTGRLTFEKPAEPIKKHTHFIIDFAGGGQLRFNDMRRFGYLDIVKETELQWVEYLSNLGPDALAISDEAFYKLIRSKKRIIKSLLLDQSVIAGLGNIYSDEALFKSRIHPRRVSAGLSKERISRLYKAMREVLNKALAARGSSVDNYVDARGRRGSFQEQHLVYGREGQECRICGGRIRREVIGSRSAHYCPKCQR